MTSDGLVLVSRNITLDNPTGLTLSSWCVYRRAGFTTILGSVSP